MTREEANKQFLKILDEYIAEKKEIFADAQKRGLVLPGLDGDRGLYTECDKKYRKRIQNLADQIDD